jgi:hypothetical protein
MPAEQFVPLCPFAMCCDFPERARRLILGQQGRVSLNPDQFILPNVTLSNREACGALALAQIGDPERRVLDLIGCVYSWCFQPPMEQTKAAFEAAAKEAKVWVAYRGPLRPDPKPWNVNSSEAASASHLSAIRGGQAESATLSGPKKKRASFDGG